MAVVPPEMAFQGAQGLFKGSDVPQDRLRKDLRLKQILPRTKMGSASAISFTFPALEGS